jgi:hypothetical protein
VEGIRKDIGVSSLISFRINNLLSDDNNISREEFTPVSKCL